MPTVKELKSTYREIIKTNKGVSYFDKQKKLYDTDPDIFDHPDRLEPEELQGYNNAMPFLRSATEFKPETTFDADLNKIKNPEYLSYTEAAKIYFEKFGGNPDRVIKHYQDLQLSEYRKKRSKNIESFEQEGRKQADEFLKHLLDVNSELNAACVTRFKTEFNSNLFEVESVFIEPPYVKNQYTRLPIRNHDYEATLIKGFAPTDAVEESILESLKELFRLKWDAVGYVYREEIQRGLKVEILGDDKVFEIFLAETLPITGNSKFKPLIGYAELLRREKERQKQLQRAR